MSIKGEASMPIKRKRRSDSSSSSSSSSSPEDTTVSEYEEPWLNSPGISPSVDDDIDPTSHPDIVQHGTITLTGKDLFRLRRHAANDTLLMCLRSEGLWRRAPFIKQGIVEDPERPRLHHDSMYYFFRSWGLTLRFTPFQSLVIQHKKNGDHLFPGVDFIEDVALPFDWTIEKSQEFIKLFDKVCEYFEKPEWHLDWNKKVKYFKSLAETMKLDQLGNMDIGVCIRDTATAREKCQLVQGLELHNFLDKDAPEDAAVFVQMPTSSRTELYLFLCEDAPDDINDVEQLWKELQKKFPIVDRREFDWGMDLFYSHGKKRLPEELVTARMEIQSKYEWLQYYDEQVPLTVQAYYKLKIQKAQELGLIKLDAEGVYVDNFDVSKWDTYLDESSVWNFDGGFKSF